MRRLILSTCLISLVSLAGAAIVRAEGPVLSYAPMPAPPPSVLAETPARQGAKRFDLPSGRVCFNQTETRDKIVSHKLTEPFQALRHGQYRGEALRARLCRWAPEQFVYEIAVLTRDGRIVHVYMNAQTGHSVDGHDEPDGDK